MTAESHPGRADPHARLLLGAALVLGCLRFVRLDAWSLWLDEVFTLADSLHGDSLGLTNFLGYSVFRLWFETIDGRPDEWQLRILPAVFGWLVIPAVHWAFAPFAGRRAAALAALLVAVSSWHVYWSQTARFYTLAQLLALIGAGLVLRGLVAASVPRLVAGIAAVGAGCLCHLSAAFVLPPLVVLPFVLRLARHDLAGTHGACGKLLLALAVLGGLASVRQVWEAWLLWQAVKGVGTPIHLLLTTGFFVTPLLGVGAGLGALVAWSRRRTFDLLALGVCILVLLEAAVASFGGRVSAQYVFVLLPWIAILAALPLSARALEAPLLRVGYAALLVLPALTTVGLYLSVRAGERPDWRGAYRYVYDHREPDDLVLGMEAPVGEYYLSEHSSDLRNQLHVTYLDTWRSGVPRQWARFDRRMWFVVNHEQFEDWDANHRERVETLLREDCRLVASFPLVVESRDLSVYVYLRE